MTLEGDPGFGIERVIVAGVGTHAIKVGPGAVEPVVDDILQGELDVALRPEGRTARLVERQVVRLEDKAIAARRTGRLPEYSTGSLLPPMAKYWTSAP
jgi:hypothetical protein